GVAAKNEYFYETGALPTVSVSPTGGSAGASVSPGVSATKYWPNETVTINFDSAVVGTAVADAAGSVPATTFTVPSTSPAGAHKVTVTGQVSSIGKSAAFTVNSQYKAAVTADAPLAYHRFNDSSGTAAADSSGHAVNGTYAPSGVTKQQPGALFGDLDKAIGADGSTVPVTNTAVAATLPVGNSARSMETWFNTAATGFQTLMRYGNIASSGHDFALNLNGANSVYISTNGNDISFPTTTNMSDARWHHVAVTYDGALATVFLDGKRLGSQPFPTLPSTQVNPADPNQALSIGGSPVSGGNFVGLLDEAAIYGSALNATKIETRMTRSGRVPSAPGTVALSAGGPDAINVNWTGSTANGSPITSYQVTALTTSANGSVRSVTSVRPTATNAVITGLAGGTTYFVKVAAVNSFGAGPSTAAPAGLVAPAGGPVYGSSTSSAVLSDAPVAYYRLDGNGSNTLTDATANARNGLYEATGVTRGVAGALSGDSDGAASGNGGPIASVAPATFLPANNTARTVEGWVKTANAGLQTVASFGTAGPDQAFTVSVDGSEVVVDSYLDQLAFSAAPNAINDSRWHHVAVTYDGTSVVAYLDGRRLGSQSFASALSTTPGPLGLVVGRWIDASSQPIYGSLDEVAIYPTALSAARIEAHVAASGDAPGAPTFVTAGQAVNTAANTAMVSWVAAPQGAAPISSYTVTAFEGTAPRIREVVPAGTTSATLAGLKGSTQYTFKVQAANAYGLGVLSTASGAYTPLGVGAGLTPESAVRSDSPVAYWRLDEAAGNTMADYSGNGRNGFYPAQTLRGVPSGLPGDSDSAVKGLGVGPVATVANPTFLPTANAARTAEAWFNSSVAGWHSIVSYGTYGGTGQVFTLYADSGTVEIDSYGNYADFTTGHVITDGQWHHIAGTWDGTTAVAYLDGVRLGSQPLPAFNTTLNADGLQIGQTVGCNCYDTTAAIDDVAIYAAALAPARIEAHVRASGHAPGTPAPPTAVGTSSTIAQVQWSAPVSTGSGPLTGYVIRAVEGASIRSITTVDPTATSYFITGLTSGHIYQFQVSAVNAYGEGNASAAAPLTMGTGGAVQYSGAVLADHPTNYYRLDNPGGAQASDYSGASRHGTWDPAATRSVESAIAGDTDSAAAADGTPVMRAGGAGLPVGNTARTVEAWVNTTNTAFQYLANYGTAATDQAFGVAIYNNDHIYVSGYSDDLDFVVPGGFADGSWHLIDVVYNGAGKVTVFLDGVSAGPGQNFTTALNTAVDPAIGMVIGGSIDNSSFLSGQIDDVAVYATALSSTRIQGHWTASGNTRF
ncbi:MAG: hypothetical protein QOG64_1591, partial [Acidimicrobiaceae bacterium]|nr:hypothetical protein [Acidimicrobiaceae bacterium]